jgi:hypothetical protein
MSYRNISFIVVGAIGACLLGTGCIDLTVQNNGTAGMGGIGGAAGMGGSGGAGGAEMPAAWWDPAWAHRTRITFQNADGKALAGFPLMIRLDALRFPDLASSTGADLRFIDDDGQTILPHEIDRWQPGGDSFVWVKVPTIDGTNTDHLWLYYGNKAVADVQNAAAVWNGFLGVYHLSPTLGTPTQFVDSAGANPGIWHNYDAGEIGPGQIGEAIGLDGAKFVDIGDNGIVTANIDQARTVEAWVNTAQVQDQAVVHEEGELRGVGFGVKREWEVRRGLHDGRDCLPCVVLDTTAYSVTATASVGTWHYLTLVIDRPGLEMQLFVDGTFKTSTVH